jgi:Spx/MgsR family transcriptional regulator
MITVYGIKNCDSVKKARKWLQEQGVNYQFHDFRGQGITIETIQEWIDQVGSASVLNKRSTSWRNLDSDQQKTVNESNLATLLQGNPTLIKRPVLNVNGIINIGFSPESYQIIFN